MKVEIGHPAAPAGSARPVRDPTPRRQTAAGAGGGGRRGGGRRRGPPRPDSKPSIERTLAAITRSRPFSDGGYMFVAVDPEPGAGDIVFARVREGDLSPTDDVRSVSGRMLAMCVEEGLISLVEDMPEGRRS